MHPDDHRGFRSTPAPALTAEQAFAEIREMEGLTLKLKGKATKALLKGQNPQNVIDHCRRIDNAVLALDGMDRV